MTVGSYLASSVSSLIFHSTAGNVTAAIVLGLAVFLAVILAGRARNVRRIRTRVDPHIVLPYSYESSTGIRTRRVFPNGLLQVTDRTFGRLRLWKKLAVALDRADWRLRPAEFFYVTIGAGLVLAAFLALVGAHPVLVMVGFLLGVIPPLTVLSLKAERRQHAFDDQLADVLMTMAGSLRAGHTFRQAMQAIVEEGDEPASKEFRRVLVEIGIGRPVDEALQAMADRMRSRNFEYVISVVAVQREVGGSLAGLFDMVSETVRRRQQFSGKVRSLTTTARVSAYILAGMPFFMAAVLSVLRPGYLTPLFDTATGRLLILIALGGILLGGIVLRRIVAIRTV